MKNEECGMKNEEPVPADGRPRDVVTEADIDDGERAVLVVTADRTLPPANQPFEGVWHRPGYVRWLGHRPRHSHRPRGWAWQTSDTRRSLTTE